MVMQHTSREAPLRYDDHGSGSLLVLLPGAGDLRSEYRFVVDRLAGSGHRVVVADLPGHGQSPVAERYGVEPTAGALRELIGGLSAGPAVVIGTSFAPAAAVWAAVDRPDLVRGVVAISPHFDEDHSLQGRLAAVAMRLLLRGPWAGALWARLYTGWYKAAPPADLRDEVRRLRAMFADPARRRAVRQTLTADRRGVAQRIARLTTPTLTVFGDADDHFTDPVAEAARVAGELGGDELIVPGAGHYPHVERPDTVADAIIDFVAHL
jgi:pimeloyl-ACP methyl ester carboxylesterase